MITALRKEKLLQVALAYVALKKLEMQKQKELKFFLKIFPDNKLKGKIFLLKYVAL